MKAFGIVAGNQDRIGVAVSGGSDSTALLLLAADFCLSNGLSCLAVTVDHGLRPEAAGESRKVGALCAELGVAHATLKWRRAEDDPAGQEAARLARHRLIADWAQHVGVTRVALGHTRDDRLETFLMRARQGSGWHGLAGLMPDGPSPVWPEGRGIRLVRPLLAFGREELRQDVRARGIAWIDDPSNEAGRYERVRMRRLLQKMDGRSRQKALHVMDRLLHMRAAVGAEASALLKQLQTTEHGMASLPLLPLMRASDEVRRRIVEALVLAAGGAERPPRRDALDRLLQRITQADLHLAGGVTLGGAKIRIQKGGMLSVSAAPARRGNLAPEPPDWSRATALLKPSDLRVLAV